MLWCKYCRIVLVDREPNATIYGKPYGWIQHAADLARIQVTSSFKLYNIFYVK